MASDCVGFTLPGMIDEPGSFFRNAQLGQSRRAGRRASQRTSLAIFISSEAPSVFTAPLAKTSSSCADSAANLFGCDLNGKAR